MKFASLVGTNLSGFVNFSFSEDLTFIIVKN